ncbi:MAG: AzlD domain-containing protein [Lachnospiraceae bacterium]|nr:AzlD domain-containing protein [Lachnospiraceae bacterium]
MLYVYILIMALTTYLIRVLPIVLVRSRLENKFIKSFLYYVPYACLTAMTIPAIFFSTDQIISAVCGFVVAVILGIKKQPLPIVAAGACIVVFIIERLPF